MVRLVFGKICCLDVLRRPRVQSCGLIDAETPCFAGGGGLGCNAGTGRLKGVSSKVVVLKKECD